MRRETVICLLIGVAAGMLAGLTGVGGGVFLVPLLVGALYLPQHEAHGTSFVVIFPIAVVGTITYAAMGHMEWGLILGLALGGVLGVLLGVRLMMLLPENRLRWLWGVFIIAIGFIMVISPWGEPAGGEAAAAASFGWTSFGIAIPIGFVSGILAGMMGIGGGVVLIPALVMIMGVSQHIAQGVSLAVISFMSLLGVLAHYRLENVRLRVALWIIPAAALFSFVGSYVASYLSGEFLRDFVGSVIIVVGVVTVVRGWRIREVEV